jgi:AraC-like DNA-binding protein
MRELCARYKEFLRKNPNATIAESALFLGVSGDLIVYIRRKHLKISNRKETKSQLKGRIKDVLGKDPNLSNRALAHILGRPKTTVVNARRELSMSQPAGEARDVLFVSISQQVRNIVLEHGEDLSDLDIAEKVGISLRTLLRWLKRLGIPSGKNRLTKPRSDQFQLMWADGWTDREISRVMGCNRRTVQQWRNKNKLIANMIHSHLPENHILRSHTPTTLLDVLGSPTGSKKLDRVWAFAALGANWKWLRKRFPDVSRAEMRKTIEHLLGWRFPKNIRQFVRRDQLRDVLA